MEIVTAPITAKRRPGGRCDAGFKPIPALIHLGFWGLGTMLHGGACQVSPSKTFS